MSVSLHRDAPPRFRAPIDVLEDYSLSSKSEISLSSEASLRRWISKAPDCADLSSVIINVASFSTYINEHNNGYLFWRQDSVAHYTLLLLHSVLSIDRRDSADAPKHEVSARESIRLALMVFLGDLKRRLGFPCGGGGEATRSKLTALMQHSSIDYAAFPDLRLWILVLCAAKQQQRSSEWSWLVKEIRQTMYHMGLEDWSSAMGITHGLIWVRDPGVYNVHALGMEVDGFVADKPEEYS